MSQVMIKCPQTGQEVSTGIAMDEATFQNADMSGNSFTCPACGQQHVWDKKDAFVK